ncbi:uncharacterized protein LOC132193942 [Neocloeon triangulifer]|uniref:uncharacterized protein LOC132193942 n=1 Tax=Neocloeon triangulifer TaxID=2078957 RepID=UPI00286EECA3|nr:uncharacterized protein LOC132193942 [Neocloeon triangulifer]
MAKQKMTETELREKFADLRRSVSDYDDLNFSAMLDLEASARRLNGLVKRLSHNLAKSQGKEEDFVLRKRVSSSFMQHQIDELNKMYNTLIKLKSQLERLDTAFSNLRRDLLKGLSADGFCGCEKYLNCFKQGINKARFFLGKLEILVGDSHRYGKQVPISTFWFKSIEDYIIGAMLEKDFLYVTPYIPPELYPTL